MHKYTHTHPELCNTHIHKCINSMNIHNTYTTHTNTHSQIHTHIQPTGFPGGAVVKNPPANAGDPRDVGLIPGSGRSPGEGNGYPLQHSCLGNPMDRRTSLVGYSPWGCKELDTNERMHTHTHTHPTHIYRYMSRAEWGFCLRKRHGSPIYPSPQCSLSSALTCTDLIMLGNQNSSLKPLSRGPTTCLALFGM